MATWITRLDPPGPGLRLAVKDAIDVEGVPTTVGSAAVAATALPAPADAGCVRRARAAGAVVVGKANLHELCFGTTGINPWFGTPINPLAPDRLPGGSSSGSAVAVAAHEADVGFGTDTGGSVRIPAACCGVVGLKTTWGRVPLDGVWPLAPTLDTLGPLARDVAGVVEAMRLLEVGFTPAATASPLVGRLRIPDVDPALDTAIDAVVGAAEVEVVEVELTGWGGSDGSFMTLLLAEAFAVDGYLLDQDPGGLSGHMIASLRAGARVSPAEVATARETRRRWRNEVHEVLARVPVIALATLSGPPPTLKEPDRYSLTRCTRPLNLAGVPALALPVPVPGWPVPGSLQLFGAAGAEELLCATGSRLESAAATGAPGGPRLR